MKRFFRDAGILLGFCGAFYLLTVVVSRLEGDAVSDDSDFSPARKRANVQVYEKNWPAAKLEFKKLTEQDPFNGYAWDSYATCIWEMRRKVMAEFEILEIANERNAAEEQELEQQIADLNNQAREAFLQLKKFARYRPIALHRLAIMECDRGNYEEAMDFIEEFVERGYQTHLGLHWIEGFGSGGPPPVPTFARIPDFPERDPSSTDIPTGADGRLHLEPRFWDLVRRERGSSIDF